MREVDGKNSYPEIPDHRSVQSVIGREGSASKLTLAVCSYKSSGTMTWLQGIFHTSPSIVTWTHITNVFF